MSGRMIFALALLIVPAATLHAQTAKTVTVRVLDGKTGDPVTPDNVVVRIDRQSTIHVEWVKLDDHGVATVTLPATATSVSVHASYGETMDYYVNCDVARQKNSSQETWYPLGDILTQGLVMPNECGRARSARSLKIEPKPGEFVVYVRKRNWHDGAESLR